MRELVAQDYKMVSGGDIYNRYNGYVMGGIIGSSVYAGAAISSGDASLGGLCRAAIRGSISGQMILDNLHLSPTLEHAAGQAALIGLGLGLVGGLV